MHLITLPNIDSTNNYAQQLLLEGKVQDGTVILANEQSAGKGQRGKRWESMPGLGLYASVILKPKALLALEQVFLNKALALAVADYVKSRTSRKSFIKWPNDILVEDEKVAGLLIENILRGDQVSAVIAGIGINLNHIQFPDGFETQAVSLRLLTGNTFYAEEEIKLVHASLRNRYEQFQNREFEKINNDYNSILYKLGVNAQYLMNDEVINAVMKRVDNDGAAVLEHDGKLISATHPSLRFYMRTGFL